jgi:hypothetical protein
MYFTVSVKQNAIDLDIDVAWSLYIHKIDSLILVRIHMRDRHGRRGSSA